MARIYDTYDMMHAGQNNLPVVTGKPVELGGSLGRREATSRGCLLSTERALELGLVDGLETVKNATVVVQGFGNVGANAAELFEEAGSKIIAVSDSRGGIYNEEGLDVAAVIEHKKETGSVIKFPGAMPVSNEELLALSCDILIPAALENQIREDNAPDIKAKLISEAANGPTTPGADKILFENGVPVLPDILANAGGVTVSYFEWVQNIENEQWDEDKVNQKLRKKIRRATDDVLAMQNEINSSLDELNGQTNGYGLTLVPINLRQAAYVYAIRRVTNVTLARGIWP
jgi:glutamate dehydrogenase (NAD(P)+)